MLNATVRVGSSNTAKHKKKQVIRSKTFGYHEPPGRQQPPRAVYQWLASEGLSTAALMLSPRRALSNGYVVAQILARYYPGDIPKAGIQNGAGKQCKQDNWELLCKCCAKHDVLLPPKLVQGTMEEVHGAAAGLLEKLYERLRPLSASQRLTASQAAPSAGSSGSQQQAGAASLGAGGMRGVPGIVASFSKGAAAGPAKAPELAATQAQQAPQAAQAKPPSKAPSFNKGSPAAAKPSGGAGALPATQAQQLPAPAPVPSLKAAPAAAAKTAEAAFINTGAQALRAAAGKPATVKAAR